MPARPIPAAAPRSLRPLQGAWQRAGFVDRVYAAYFVGLSALLVLQRHRVPGWLVLLALHAGALLVIAALVITRRRLPSAHAWYPLLMPVVTFPAVARLNLMFAGGWRDAWLLALEASLCPEPPAFWLRRVVPPLGAELFRIGYLSYFLLLLIVAGIFRRRGLDGAFRGVIAASVLGYLFCYVVFLAVPMEGPVHTLRELSGPPPADGPVRTLVLLVQRAGVHGNAFPSAHVAGAMPPFLFAWRHRRGLGAVLGVLIALMGLGAVYDGYHYASDVVAGVIVGWVAAWLVMAAQDSPVWARRLHLPRTSATTRA